MQILADMVAKRRIPNQDRLTCDEELHNANMFLNFEPFDYDRGVKCKRKGRKADKSFEEPQRARAPNSQT